MEWERITISNHHLKSLELTDCQHLVELKIDAPKLCKFLYAGVYLKYFSSNALTHSQALLQYDNECSFIWIVETKSLCESWSAKKIKFLPNLTNSKFLQMMFYSAKGYLVFIYLFISFDYLNLFLVLVIFSISPLTSFGVFYFLFIFLF